MTKVQKEKNKKDNKDKKDQRTKGHNKQRTRREGVKTIQRMCGK